MLESLPATTNQKERDASRHRVPSRPADRFFAGTARTSRKPDGTEVTDTGLAVAELIRGGPARRAPGDEVHGEEAGTTGGTSGRRWVIDPVDGTYYFARRIPVLTTQLAFEDEHGPALGVIREPVARQTIYAGRGRGCHRATDTAVEPARVSTRTRFEGARTAMINPGTWSEALLTALHRKVFLSTAGDIVALVTGQAMRWWSREPSWVMRTWPHCRSSWRRPAAG